MHNIIGITGRIGSGKDTVASYLVEEYGFTKLSFAGTLKDAVSIVFGWDRELVEGATPEARAWRETVDEWWAKRLELPGLTPRWVLQQWGTDVLRKNFHNDIWVASLARKLESTVDNVVITDCRFPNELKEIKMAGGITVRVERGETPEWYADAIKFNQGIQDDSSLIKRGIHASEYSSVGLDYDYYIANDSTKLNLYNTINHQLADHLGTIS